MAGRVSRRSSDIGRNKIRGTVAEEGKEKMRVLLVLREAI